MSERPYTTALYVLRCIQLGLHIDDLDQLTYGMVVDIMTEQTNDGHKYRQLATQEDFDRF